ncbi:MULTISPECIES: pimeloyl-ACP methyl ester esterase BioH [unclassified Methylophaga]|jgi:pimeloyl-[acyl-carrier protein] methyl ester esterase|uniref:pimeloyl-ACP methyl ester esterase BioH n=1 Tax=unclassified Methylophaga TaxID=2629249 RepID=UPI000C8BC9F7|nr:MULTISPECIES: pimeloyl-ACP methyl ester esterase BioH [unclassified Methylophaga]MAK67750.1 pimeloyl-[acyl-carrier protein] methyl ester esterase [Methylophaga sp.]MAY18431.1 pimeloyl-[acyl-carrier protein] methyl ester esterase [Methylophaga sp.]HAO23840.1 pimeloyl-[acyl-carrier protein] methyl ester esterase [Methylophaga sp.]|tara:strand:- start:21788 stop:22546 length:759 start_codon:yes stop_codon:yes gene_type:complete
MYIKQMGQGPDVVMLHGWSMHSDVWQPLAEILAQQFTLHLIDLPGHGQSEWQADALQIDKVLTQLADNVPQTAYWLGWSLGGQLSLAFASRYPQRVTKLVLMAANPKFVTADNWSEAMDAAVFAVFAGQLNYDQRETLKRFVLLQARGAKGSRETIQLLAEKTADNVAHPEALQAGLALLETLDLRSELAQLQIPVKCLLGDRDQLVPITLVESLSELNKTISIDRIAGAGHAPFISQPQLCADKINEFFND